MRTIAISCSSAAAMTSSSRTEPPGCTTARARSGADIQTVSKREEGVRANDRPFQVQVTALDGEPGGVHAAHLPAPIPTTCSAFAKTMAFDLTCLHTFHASSIACASCSVGGSLSTDLALLRGAFVGVLHQHAV